MASLRLISLVCNEAEDRTGPNEVYLLIAHRRVWDPQYNDNDNDNDVADLTGLPDAISQ